MIVSYIRIACSRQGDFAIRNRFRHCNSTMSPLLTLLPVLVLTLFLLEPFATYFRDVKNLRRFPDAFPLSGVSNIPFVLRKRR